MLEANYGPGWKVPDPSFRFAIPPSVSDRFYQWFSDYDMDRPLWEDHYRYDVRGDGCELGSAPSSYAEWLDDRLPRGSAILELGSGRGHDALWLARQGHRLDAIDYVLGPLSRAEDVAVEQGLPARFRTLNLYDLRRVLALGAEVAARREPVVVYGRGLLGSLWDSGRPALMRLLSMVLRSGGQAHLDLPRRSLQPEAATGLPLHRTVDIAALRTELAGFGLQVDEVHDAAEHIEHMPWDADDDRLPTTRMVVTWQRGTR
jgi:SAM-dependent methyltransferase